MPHVTIPTHCPKCQRRTEVTVREDQYLAWMSGANIQDALPDHPPDTRELLLSGLCPICWEDLLGDAHSPSCFPTEPSE